MARVVPVDDAIVPNASANSEVVNPDLTEKQVREGYGFWLAAWARGPDTINAALWGAVLLTLASADALCAINPDDGLSSGADGESCTGYHHWDDELWRSLNGTACEGETSFGDLKYIHDPNPQCQEAIAAYRMRTEPRYTCNCTGDYAFLGGEGGMRPSVVFTFAQVISNVVLIVLVPITGAYCDCTPHRKRVWQVTSFLTVLCTALMAVLGTDYVWVVGLIAATGTAIFYELMCLPIVAYLPEIGPTEALWARYGGRQSAANYMSQIAMGIILVICTFTFQGKQHGAQVVAACVGCLLTALWIAGFMRLSLKQMAPRPASKELFEGKGPVGTALSQLCKTFATIKTQHPQAMRYLIVNALAAGAINATIPMFTTYCVAQLKLTGLEFLLVYVIVLTIGAPCALCYGWYAKYFRSKTICLFLLTFLMLLTLLTPLGVYKPGQLVAVFSVAGFVGYGFGTWFSINSVIWCELIPPGSEGEYTSLRVLSTQLFQWLPPLIYVAIVQAANDHRIALMHVGLYYLVAIAILCKVDFDKGAQNSRQIIHAATHAK